MKKLISIFFLCLLIITTKADTYYINSGNFYFSPSSLIIDVNDTVVWLNNNTVYQGIHNVNFDISSTTGNSFGNPVSFISSPTGADTIHIHTFSVPGFYQYDCSVGSHAAGGMVGNITVNQPVITLPTLDSVVTTVPIVCYGDLATVNVHMTQTSPATPVKLLNYRFANPTFLVSYGSSATTTGTTQPFVGMIATNYRMLMVDSASFWSAFPPLPGSTNPFVPNSQLVNPTSPAILAYMDYTVTGVPFSSSCPSIVSTSVENKNVVLEAFTGIYNTFDPDGHRIANDIYSNDTGDVVLINIHTGGFSSPMIGDPNFQTQFGSAIAAQSSLFGYPAGTVNRRVFAGLGQNGGTAMSRGNWQSASSQILNEPSYVNVAAQANLDISTRQLSVTVEAYYTGNSPVTTNKLNVALMQNNVEGPQSGASYNPNAILPNGNYNHQHMLRHMLTGQWGDDITNTNSGSFFTNTYTYTIPNDLNGISYELYNLEVAVFLTETQQNVVTGNMASMNYITSGVNLIDLMASSNMIMPSSYCDNNLTPEITVTNNTTVPVDTFAVSYTLNNNAPVTQNVYSSLQPGSSTTISFNSITVPSGTNNISYAVSTVANTSYIDSVPNNNLASIGSFNTLSPTSFATNHSEGFEGFALATPAPNNAILENPQDNWVGIIDGTYTQGQPVGGYGSSMNSYRFRLNSFSAGQSAKLIWEKLDFSDVGNYQIKYDLAHALKNSWDGDVIQILVSTDCGVSWDTVSQMSGSSTATYGTVNSSGYFNPLTIGGTTNYYPSNNTSSLQHWRTDSVDLSTYNGNPDVMVAINVICGGGNNLYLDNVVIAATACSTNCILLGCTDSTAVNYNSLATVDDSSCVYCNLTNTYFTIPPSSATSCDGLIIANAYSQIPISSYNWYDSNGFLFSTNNIVDSLCNGAYIFQLVDSAGCTVVDTIYLGTIYGCTDTSAINYNWTANTDDSSCISIVYGCTDSIGTYNYDSLANVDDGSCCYITQILQRGQDIDGEAAGDNSGHSVSLSSDGNTLAIGAYLNDGNGSDAGHVRIYDWTGNLWVQRGNDIDGEAAGDHSGGHSVSLSSDGNTVAIGAPYNDGNGSDAGHVRIYDWNGSSWIQRGQDIDGEAANDNSGYSVSLSSDGNTVAIGALGNDGNGIYAGHVRIYDWTGNFWFQRGNDIDGESVYDYSGWSVSLSSDGNTVAIGATGNDGNGSNSGHVRIYDWTGNFWFQRGNDIDGESVDDNSGFSASLSSDGNTVAIGAPYNDGNGSNSGHVRIYDWTGNLWVQRGNDIDGESAGDYSGHSISLSADGNTVAIGAHGNDGNGSNSGHFRIYDWTGNLWVQRGNDIDGEAIYDLSGWSVTLSSDGNTVAIGADSNDGNGSNSGHVRIYHYGSLCAGCTDPLALNYDSTIQYDNGSCIYPQGCTDTVAYNYDPQAIVDDSSCLYCDLSFSLSVFQNTNNLCNGLAYISSYNTSNPPVSYQWSNGNSSNNVLNLCTGTYTVSVTDLVGCIVTDTFYIGPPPIAGCTDPLATNYDPLATVDDGSCIYSTACTSPSITGLGVSNVIHNRATLTFDDMNSSSCRVDQLRIKYRELGTNAWSQKNMGSPTGYDPVTGICNSTSRTDKLLLGLSSNTTYEWQMRVWYCSTGNTPWVNGPNFTTLDDCPNVGNLAVTTPTTTKATFTWDDSNGPYSFVRLQGRVDTVGSSFFNIGGVGVQYGTYTKNKNGLVPGTSYRAKSRTWCDPNGGAYKAPSWTSFIYFTMPGSVRLEGSTMINDLDIYPNPSRDVFNISFKTVNKQDITLRIRNIVGEEIYTEELREFDGTYTKAISLENYTKAVYFLEINTNQGTINKKLILQ